MAYELDELIKGNKIPLTTLLKDIHTQVKEQIYEEFPDLKLLEESFNPLQADSYPVKPLSIKKMLKEGLITPEEAEKEHERLSKEFELGDKVRTQTLTLCHKFLEQYVSQCRFSDDEYVKNVCRQLYFMEYETIEDRINQEDFYNSLYMFIEDKLTKPAREDLRQEFGRLNKQHHAEIQYQHGEINEARKKTYRIQKILNTLKNFFTSKSDYPRLRNLFYGALIGIMVATAIGLILATHGGMAPILLGAVAGTSIWTPVGIALGITTFFSGLAVFIGKCCGQYDSAEEVAEPVQAPDPIEESTVDLLNSMGGGTRTVDTKRCALSLGSDTSSDDEDAIQFKVENNVQSTFVDTKKPVRDCGSEVQLGNQSDTDADDECTGESFYPWAAPQ